MRVLEGREEREINNLGSCFMQDLQSLVPSLIKAAAIRVRVNEESLLGCGAVHQLIKKYQAESKFWKGVEVPQP